MSNTNKTPYLIIKERRTKQNDIQKKSKTNKFMNIFFPILGVSALIAGAALATVGIVAKSRINDESTKIHPINFSQTIGWQITGPTNAKFGDKVKFEVTSTSNELGNEVPDSIKIKDLTKPLYKNSLVFETEEFSWPFIEQVEVSLTTKKETVKTYNVLFNLNGGVISSGQEKTLSTIVKEKSLFNSITKPSFAAPKDMTFDYWQDQNGNNPMHDPNYTIDCDTVLTAIYKKAESIQHTITFILDADEVVSSGDTTLTILDGKTWADVKQLNNFPIINKSNYSIGCYYIYNGSQCKELSDDYKFTFDSSTNLSININWTTQKKLVTFKNTNKTVFALGKSEETIEVMPNTSFTAVSRPVVLSTTSGTIRYVPNGKWYTKSDLSTESEFNGSINEAITLYAGYDEVSTLTHSYVVNFINAYGFKEGTTSIWSQSHEEAVNYTWADIKTSAPSVDKLIFPDGKELNESEYSFVGWSISDDTTIITEGTTNVVAKFEIKEKHYYSIIFTSDDAVAWSGSQSYFFETTDSSKVKVGDLTNAATPSKDGSTLIGWTYISTKNGTKIENEIKGTDWLNKFKALKFADIMDEDTTITFKPIFETDTTKHLIHFLSSDTTKGTVVAKEGFNLMSYVDNTTTFGSIKNNVVCNPKSGFSFSCFRNGATGNEMSDSDLITTDTIVFVDFSEDTGGFQGKTWNETAELCTKLENNEITSLEFAQEFLPTATSINDLVGLEGTVKVNGLLHTVRAISVQHNTLSNSTAKAAITFEFANLLSDSDGYPLTMYWGSNTSSGNNTNYLNGFLASSLNNEGSLSQSWLKYKGSTFWVEASDDVKSKSVYNMLQDAGIPMKQISHKVNIHSGSSTYTSDDWTSTSINEYVFINSAIGLMGETIMSKHSNSGWSAHSENYKAEDESQYEYYKNTLPITNPNLWATDTTTGATGKTAKEIVLKYSTNKTGCWAWTRSPFVSNNISAWCCILTGQITSYSVASSKFAIAPCFCL